MFFSVTIWKNVVAKKCNKIFPHSDTQTKIFGRQMESSDTQRISKTPTNFFADYVSTL